jgi:membrane-associated protein
LLIGVILPGDSLLFIVGMLIASNFITTPLVIALLLMAASAIAGNLLGYWTGSKIGPKLFSRPNSKIFKAEYVVTTQNFFEKHGTRAIVLARFVPIVRSVITGMAGVARMDYKTYATFSTIGGIVWVGSLTLAGYFLGSIPFIKENIDFVAIGIVLLSLIPVIFEVLRQRKQSKN